MLVITLHVLDTGPLLCLGSSEPLRESYDTFMLKHGRVVGAVYSELQRHQALDVTKWGSDMEGRKVKRDAAQGVLRHYSDSLLGSSKLVMDSAVNPPLLDLITQALKRASEAKARHYGSSSVPSNEGEAHSIYAILTTFKGAACFVSNDNGARTLAQRFSINAYTLVDLFRYICFKNKVDAREKKRIFRALVACSRKLDIGDVIVNVSDLDISNVRI